MRQVGREIKNEEKQKSSEAGETHTGLWWRKKKYSCHKSNDTTLNYSKECVVCCRPTVAICVCVYLHVNVALNGEQTFKTGSKSSQMDV